MSRPSIPALGHPPKLRKHSLPYQCQPSPSRTQTSGLSSQKTDLQSIQRQYSWTKWHLLKNPISLLLVASLLAEVWNVKAVMSVRLIQNLCLWETHSSWYYWTFCYPLVTTCQLRKSNRLQPKESTNAKWTRIDHSLVFNPQSDNSFHLEQPVHSCDIDFMQPW